MPYEWVFSSLGGGLLGLFGVIIVFLSVLIYWDLRSQIKEHKDANKELRAAVNRLADVVETWTPEAQRRRLRT